MLALRLFRIVSTHSVPVAWRLAEHFQPPPMVAFVFGTQVGIFDRADPLSSKGPNRSIALLGDTTSPTTSSLLGLGSNWAFEDLGLLALSLEKAGGVVATALGMYEMLRVKRAADAAQCSKWVAPLMSGSATADVVQSR